MPVTTNFLVDSSGGLSQVVADTDESGSLAALYIRNGNELLAVMRPTAGGTWTTRFVHSDGLASVRVLTDETGTTVDSRAYEAFGIKNVEAGSDPLAYGFAGERFQADSMLAYHRARWMDPRLGRFDGMDALDGQDEQPTTWHRYMYASGDPTNRTDPSGNLDADFSLLMLFGRPTTAPQGKTFNSIDLAVSEALAVAAAKSSGLSGAQIAGEPHISDSPLHPEVPAVVNEYSTPQGRKYTYTVGAASHLALGSSIAYQPSTLAALLHTHPNVGTVELARGRPPYTFEANVFSCSDANAHQQAILDVLNATSGNRQYIGSFVQTGAGNVLAWYNGFSVPYDGTPVNNGKPCP